MRFSPCYIFATELDDYGLPSPSLEPKIMFMVRSASSLIDQHCGRIDGSGNGSLCYSTYTEQLPMPALGRNIVRVSFRPMVAVSTDKAASLTAMQSASASLVDSTNFNHLDTFVTPNTINGRIGTLSSILGCSGRYAYSRRGEQQIYTDWEYGSNPLMTMTYFGGPPTWSAMDVTQIDWDAVSGTGQLWIPAGLYMSSYNEILVSYNSGYDPTDMPVAIKLACADIVRNYMAKGGVSGAKGVTAADTLTVQMNESLIDPNIEERLLPYVSVVAM